MRLVGLVECRWIDTVTWSWWSQHYNIFHRLIFQDSCTYLLANNTTAQLPNYFQRCKNHLILHPFFPSKLCDNFLLCQIMRCSFIFFSDYRTIFFFFPDYKVLISLSNYETLFCFFQIIGRSFSFYKMFALLSEYAKCLFFFQITRKFSMSNEKDTPVPEEHLCIRVALLHPESTLTLGQHLCTRKALLHYPGEINI